MKDLLLIFALVAAAATPSFSQVGLDTREPIYLVDYFSNNPGPNGLYDQKIRLVNFGAEGTPLTSPQGDVCANIYVFDASQELVACCSCRITPNAMLTLSVANNLTRNPLTSVVPVNGDVKIVSTRADATCSAQTQNGGGLNSIVGFGTHLQIPGSTTGTYISETIIPAMAPPPQESLFLVQACQFARYLGSGKGTCSCNPIP